ncbi:Histidine kinase [Chitinophaga sp. CF118]|uniref:sensor histidine kinase n=1 Tax=Chitinophaga sp. CF118 TaxID=1884367 RepID=UPI0008E63767|nr:histidine kinase [Chitinophaga sp. CF118]SFF04068.1 Histidine kinase [Chitinophaga sp. CF118]
MRFSSHPNANFFRDKGLSYHLLGWALFILYEVSFVTLLIGSSDTRNIVFDYVLPYIVNIGLFYVHAHIVLSYSFRAQKRSYSLFFALTLIELVLYLYLMLQINSLSGYRQPDIAAVFTHKPIMPLLRQLWRGIYFIGFSSAYWFAIRNIRYEKKVLQLEKQQMADQIEKNNLEKGFIEMQNAYLQSQVNPHMLFNTLNFVYNNVQQASQEASEAIILLSELMNYSLRELEPDGKVSLEREIEQIKNIIKINQIRFSNKLYLDAEFNGEFDDVRIIPMCLLPFIENVFKHANLINKEAPGKITVSFNAEHVELVTLNQKKTRSKTYSHGTGLVNIRKRLNNLYKDAYSLNINNDEHDFYVHLVIKL